MLRHIYYICKEYMPRSHARCCYALMLAGVDMMRDILRLSRHAMLLPPMPLLLDYYR